MLRSKLLPFALFGFVAKCTLIIAWHIWPAQWLLQACTTWDPLPFWFAERFIEDRFSKGIAPQGASETFEFLLAIGSALEFALAAAIYRFFTSVFGKPRKQI